MSNAIQNSQTAPANQAGRSSSRFVRTSVRPVVFKLSRKLSVTYWPGRRRSISAVLLALLSGFVPGLAGAGPTGGQVVAGSAAVLRPTSSTTQVNQSSQNAIINWQSFSIGAGEAVRFVQPSASAVALNRVIGADPSRIFGSLTANGKVFLVNNAGVYFAPGASVDVGGLVATSMNISNASFLSGKYKFEAGSQAGAVTNDGSLRGAFVVLAAPQVSNAGSIVTTGGATALAAGGRVALDIAGDKLVSLSVDAAAANAAVSNSGSISADGGKVFMTASSANAVLDTVINTSGIVRAGSIVERNGQIVIDGGAAGTVQVGGTLAASGAGTGASGGSVQVLGQRVALQGGASIDVSGDTGGGSALVGGDLHGAGGVKTAAFTDVAQGAVINADALASGDGGKVVVWADQHTGFRGAISARGGAAGGDGGFVETSGKKTLAFGGKVNTTAARGATGTLLLDPTDITITNAVSSSPGMGESGGIFGDPANASSDLNVGDLTTALGSSNVVVDTAGGAVALGNITVASAITWGSANSLTLKADSNITVNAPIVNAGSGAIRLNADGAIASGSLTSNGGDIEIRGTAGGSNRAGSVTGTAIGSNGGNVSILSNGDITTGSINAGSGTISILGNSNVAINAALATTNTGASAIVVNAGAAASAGDGSGGNVSVTGGSLSVGAGGRATLYTGTVAGSTGVTAAVGAGSGNFRYNSDAAITNFAAPVGAGIIAVYREQPTLTVEGGSASITYGDAVPSFTPTYTGLQNNDTAAQAFSSIPTSTVGSSLSSSGHQVAGSHAVAASGAVDQLGYNVTYANGTLLVAQKSLASSGSTATGKDYDGTTAATVNTTATAMAFGGANSGDGLAYNGDVVSINPGSATTGAFLDKNAGINKAISITGLTLQGSDSANYTVNGSANATIAPKALTANATASDKVYDGNTSAVPALTIASGLVGSETLVVSATGNFNTKNVETANQVTVGTVSLADGSNGGLAANYTLGTGQTATAHITPKALTANLVSAANKTYDGTTSGTATMAVAGGLVGSETVSAAGIGNFNTKDAATADHVTVDTVVLTDGTNGGLASNYSAAAGQTGAATITPKALTLTLATADKAYDGTTTAAATMAVASGLVGSETVNASGTATFNAKDVLTANTVTVNSVTLTDGANGGLGSNYTASAGQTGAAQITRKALTAIVAAPDKTYDGNAVAAPTLSIAAGLVAGETLGVTGTATFNSKDVLAANQVTVNSVALADGSGSASNYSLAAGQTVAAHIMPKALTASLVSAADKTYDGMLDAAVTMTINPVGFVGTETVAASGSATFNTKDVLTANQLTVNNVVLSDGAGGGLASNYSAAGGQTAAAHITPKALTATAAPATKVYDGNTSASTVMNILPAGLVGTETVTATGAGAFNSRNVHEANQVTVNVIQLANGANGGLASNYSLASGQVGTGSISVRPSVTWTGPASGNWLTAANWESGAIPDFANVANVVIPVGKSVTFTTGVTPLNGAVQVASINGAGALIVSNGALTVANGLQIGSYAQAGGLVNAASFNANGAFSQTGGKLTVAGQAEIAQASGAISLGDFNAASLSISGGANVTQLPSSAVVISDTLTLATGDGDVTLSGVNNNFNKVVIGSAHNVTLAELGTGGISLAGNVAGDLNLSAHGLVSQSAALNVQGGTVIDTGGTIKLDDPTNAFHGQVEVNSTADTRLASSGALVIGGNVGGHLVLTAAGALTQAAGDALLVTGTSTIDAGANAIALTGTGNHFGGALAFKGGTVSLVDSGALALGQGSANTLSVKTGGDLSQTGSLSVAGASSFDATGHKAVLNATGNAFGGKVTLSALQGAISTGGSLDLNATAAQSLTVAAAEAKIASAEALNLHLTSGAATVNAAKALGIDGAITGPLTATAGGAVTQGAALTVSGASAINAAGQNITLADAGNDFGGSLALTGASIHVADKNALSLGASTVSGTFKASAKGDITQQGALAVAGASGFDTTGTLVLANAANDFVGAVDAAATNVVLADQNLLTVSKVTAPKVDLGASTGVQMAAGGLIDSSDVTFALPAGAVTGRSIGTPASSIAVKNAAKVTLAPSTPAVPVYVGGVGVNMVIANPVTRLAYLTEVQPELFLGGTKVFNDVTGGATSTINSQISQIMEATQKKADSNAELIDRGLGADLTVPIPYPHTGLVRAGAPRCENGGNALDGCN